MPDDQRSPDGRPSPDALLASAGSESRGRLKIFFGAAPGVGKTYEMLLAGRARLAEGADVAVGVVETHGRKETEALLNGLPVVPRARVQYHGQALEEMDIDAILARRPALVLVDELAHTNAAGSRHPKRYQDVEELLEAGIDVYTTMNVQHVESLNDVVAQITGIRVRETVPDFVIDRADDIELIDITPSDLLKRMEEGKIYMAATARRAIENYFTPGNLTALRELALRRTAQRVDDQLLTHMQSHAISGPWGAGERVLVAVDDHPRGPALVRYTRRVAERLRAPWVAVSVETARAATMSEQQKDRLAATLRLAEQLGGQAVGLTGTDIATEIVRYATATNVTHIVAGKPGKARWREQLFGSVVQDLIRAAGDISVHVISGNDEKAPRPVLPAAAAATPRRTAGPYLWTTVFVIAALCFGLLLDRVLDVGNIALVFLIAVLASALTFGLGTALYASLIGAFTLNFFFLEPLYTLNVSDPTSVVALGFFLIVATTASNLAARVQRQAATVRRRARTTEDLYQFARKLAGTGTLDDVLWATAYQIASMLKVRVVLLLPEGDGVAVRAGYPPDDVIGEADIAAARWAWDNDRPAGRGADTLPGARRLYIPLRTGRTPVGVIGLDNDKTGPLFTPEERRLFDALADQAAIAIERIQLVADVDRARLAAEADRLRSALLTSISHDLKTPLAAIMGSAGTLRDFRADLPDSDKLELLSTVIDESERLSRFIANLLDMTRIEAGAALPNVGLNYIGDVVGTALQRASKMLAGHRVETDIPTALPMVSIDPVLFEQVLFNLLDNASKYAPEGSTVSLIARAENRDVVLQVTDEGLGIPSADLERIFDSFYRAQKGDQVRAGTGLGLSICRGFVEAMGGTIVAGNRADGSGAVFAIRMPLRQVAADKLEGQG